MTEQSIFPPLKRVEDATLLTGKETFIHDLAWPNALYARFLRSTHAHARLTGLHKPELLDNVNGMFYDGRQLNRAIGPLPVRGQIPPAVRHLELEQKDTIIYPFAEEVTLYVGQPIGVVLAANHYAAEDLAEQFRIDYEPLAPVVSIDDALRGGQIVLPDWQHNIAAKVVLRKGEAARALQGAAYKVTETFRSNRCQAAPLETRGVAARFDQKSGTLTVWTVSQTPHGVKRALANILPLSEDSIDVQVPNVGGAFGAKVAIYPEDLVIPYLAYHTGSPVIWQEDRLEHFVATGHAREQVHHITLAADASGRFLALHDKFYLDGGAYNATGIILAYNSASHLIGPYVIPHVYIEGAYVLTHKTPMLPYRGAGRPEAVFAMERAIDRLAREIGEDPTELRRRNMIPDGDEPYNSGLYYRDGQPMRIDSRRFHTLLGQLQEVIRVRGYRERQAVQRRKAADKQIGIGWATYIEGTGIGPFESARIKIEPEGIVSIWLGTSSHGQGHRTTLAQIAAAALQLDVTRFRVRTGDTKAVPRGIGTMASRVAVLGGSAVWQGARTLIERAKEEAGQLLEVAYADLVYENGFVHPAGAPNHRISLFELAEAGVELDALIEFSPETVTFGGGVHAAIVELDPQTGDVEILDYLVAHEGGLPINPTIVEGQIAGGVAQGIGQALLEQLHYNRSGQMLTQSFMDYVMPSVMEIPSLVLEHVHVPSRLNPLGIKGVGEAGAICPPAALANAIEDALQGEWVVRSVPIRIDEQVLRRYIMT